MAFDNTNKANVAFKNLQNKSHTDAAKELGNEAEGIFLNVDSNTIFTDIINTSAAIAVADDIAFQVTADLVLDTTSNGHAYFAEWPNPLPVNAPDGVVSGDRVRNSISPAYGVDYEAKPYDTGSDLISPGDSRSWIYQYQSGIFYQQDNVGALPNQIIIYVYTGKYLAQSLEAAVAGDVSSINYSKANMDKSCEIAEVGDVATLLPVLEYPISDILIKLNGLQLNTGSTKDCYFSPDGIVIRDGGSAQLGDFLYWNSSSYGLDVIDEVDFIYMVSEDINMLSDGAEIVLETNTNTKVFSFTGSIGNTATVELSGEIITVGIVGANFVWDISGTNEHTFTSKYEYITVNHGTVEDGYFDFVIRFDEII